MRALILAIILGVFAGACRTLPPEPSGSVPIVYRLNWWAHQGGMSVDSFVVGQPTGALQLFNNNASVDITIAGHISAARGWRPYVSAIHVSERFEPNAAAEERHALIEFTPVVAVKNDEAYAGSAEPFAANVTYPLSTWSWGSNKLQLLCDGKQQMLELHQWK